jgi:hypothetical protein
MQSERDHDERQHDQAAHQQPHVCDGVARGYFAQSAVDVDRA